MKTSYLTAKEVEAAKPDPKRRIELPAGVVPGLYLVVQPTGAKSWCLRYRHGGRTRKHTIGTYPAVTLAKARRDAGDALGELAEGRDPAAAKVEARGPATFGTAFDEYLKRHLIPNTRGWEEVRRVVAKDALPRWRRVPLAGIGKADVLSLLDDVVDRGSPAMANKTLSVLKRFFNWSAGRGLLDSNPAAAVRRPAVERSRDRVLSLDELAGIWGAAPGLGYPLAPFFQLLMLTAQRRNEVATMRWEDLDLEAGLWTLPAESTKAGRVHDVPLSGAALDILAGLPRFDGPFTFTTTSGNRPINGFSKAKARLDSLILDRRREADPDAGPMGGWTIHDLRRSAATHMAGLGVAPHVLSAILNHAPSRIQGVTAIYNRHRYARERREALETWAERIAAVPALRLEAV